MVSTSRCKLAADTRQVTALLSLSFRAVGRALLASWLLLPSACTLSRIQSGGGAYRGSETVFKLTTHYF